MRKISLWTAAIALTAFNAPVAGATTLTIDNFSFESPVAPNPPGYQTPGPPANWSGSSAFTGVYNPTQIPGTPPPYPAAPNGNQAAYVNPGYDITTLGATNTINTYDLVAGTYTLSVYVDNRGGADPATISLLAGGTTLGTATVVESETYTPALLNAPGSADNWYLVTLPSVTVTSATPGFNGAINIELASGDSSNGGIADFDDVQLSMVATPLPAALPLFAAGLGVMGFFVYRRKKTAAKRSVLEFA